MSLLENHLRLVLRDVDGVDVTTGLDTEAGARSPSRQVVYGWDINVLAGVELEAWLGGVDLEVDLALRVVRGNELLKGRRPRVDGDVATVGVGDEAVVDVGLLLTEREGLARADARVLLGGSGWDAAVIDHLVFVGDQGDLSASNRWLSGQVEVAFRASED